MSNNNRPARTQGRAPAPADTTGTAPASTDATASTDAAETDAEPRKPANAGDTTDPSTRNNDNAASTADSAASRDTGINLADADTTTPISSASPTEPSPTAAEAEAAAAARDHGAAAFAGALDVATGDDGEPKFSDGLDTNGLRVASAFQDSTTGQRVAPGDPVPAHILEDGARMERLRDGGFITDQPLKPAPAQAVPGGILTISRSREDGDHGDHGRAQPLGSRRP